MGAIGYGLGVIGAGIGIGLAAYGATSAIARQPEMQSRLFTVFILGSAFVEALALIGFVVTLSAEGHVDGEQLSGGTNEQQH